MNIEQVKELLVAAEKPCGECEQAVRSLDVERCGHQVYAEMRLKSHAIPLAEELVKSQSALEKVVKLRTGCGFVAKCVHKEEWKEARAALRLEKLEMKEPPPR